MTLTQPLTLEASNATTATRLANDGRPSNEGTRQLVLRYALCVIYFATAHSVVSASWKFLGPAIYAVFLGAVVIAALYGGPGAGPFAAVLATFDLYYSFTPAYDLSIHHYYLAIFAVVAFITCTLQAIQSRAQARTRQYNVELEFRVRERTAELLTAQEQLGLLVNGATDLAFFMLDEQDRVSSWNAGAERLLGYQSHDVKGTTLERFCPGQGVSQVTLYRRSETGSVRPTGREFEDWFVRRDGSRFWAHVLLTSVRDPAGETCGLAVAVRDMTERRSLERDILEISERERERIGRDLHDGIGQEMTGVALLASALASQLNGSSAEGINAEGNDAERIADLVQESIRHVRELARGLSPINLDDTGLPAAIRQLAERTGRLPGLSCACTVPDSVAVEPYVAAHLFRIAQEAVGNAVRHARAGRIDIELTSDARRLQLRVSDDGAGIPSNVVGAGMGLRLMRFRAKAIRASFDLGPGVEPPVGSGAAGPAGTVVTVTRLHGSLEAREGTSYDRGNE